MPSYNLLHHRKTGKPNKLIFFKFLNPEKLYIARGIEKSKYKKMIYEFHYQQHLEYLKYCDDNNILPF